MTPQSDGLSVLIVDPSERGGIARYTERLVEALRLQGVMTLLAAPRGSADSGLELAVRRWGPDVEALGRVRLYALRLRELLPAVVSLRRAVSRAQPDVVHFQAEVVPGIDHRVLQGIRRRAGVVLTVHDALSMIGRAEVDPDEVRRWRQADAVIVHSEQFRAVVAAHAPAVPVHVVPVDLNLGSAAVPRSEARARLGLGEGPIALVLGFLRPYKGLDLLASAWPGVIRAMPEARLMLVGEAHPSEELDRLCTLEGVELRPGFLPDEEVDFWAAAADVVVMPYDRGSHSGVLHRALAMATPVLGSPPLAEEVERTGAGRVVVLQPDAWSTAMLKALGSDPIPPPVQLRSGRTAADTIAVYRDVLFRRARSKRPGTRGPKMSVVPASEPQADAPMRVVYSVEGDVFGGVERHLLTVLHHLDRVHFEPVVLGRAVPALRTELQDLSIEFIPLPEVMSKWDVRSWGRVLGVLRQLNPQVFHGMQSHSFSGRYPLAGAILARVPRVVVTCHLPTSASNARQDRLGAILRRGVDVQIAPGPWAQAELARTGQLTPRCVVIPNGIDETTLVPRADARSMLGLDPDALVVGCLMRLEPEKRADLVVGLARSLPGVTVVVFGDGPERDRLTAMAQGSDVLLAGFRPDAASLVSALDVFVHPCPVDNQPLAVLEAMAGGVPVVVADQGGTVDMVDHERTGLLAPATAQGMADAVQRLLKDKELSGALAAAAVDHVARKADPAAMTRLIEDLYEAGKTW